MCCDQACCNRCALGQKFDELPTQFLSGMGEVYYPEPVQYAYGEPMNLRWLLRIDDHVIHVWCRSYEEDAALGAPNDVHDLRYLDGPRRMHIKGWG